MYTIKQIPEDFVVDEKLNLKCGNGAYSCYILWKRDLTTAEAVKRVSRNFHVDPKSISYCGLKDRRAVTTQYISIRDGPRKNWKEEHLKLNFVGKRQDRLYLGELEGNAFSITVRRIQAKPKPLSRVLNLFDDQRFGNEGKNAVIGRLLVLGNFREAASLLSTQHKSAEDFFSKHGTDMVGTIRSIPKKLLRLYVHAYQSDLWNQAATQLKESELEELPIVGFDTEFEDDPIAEVYSVILEKEGITQRDFIIRELGDISPAGIMRPLYAEVEELHIGDVEVDDLNKGENKCTISFFLKKGSYATIVIKQLFGEI